jgi:hypothetical protein
MAVAASAAQILRAFAASEKERGLFGENTMRGPASSVNGLRQKKILKKFLARMICCNGLHTEYQHGDARIVH